AQRDLDQAEAQNRFAQLQLQRGKQLVASNTISQNDFDQRVSGAEVANANVAAARQRVAQKKAKLDTATTRLRETQQNAPRTLVAREAALQVRKANLDLAEAQLKQAQLNLSYAKIAAPAAGVIGKKSVNVSGNYVKVVQRIPVRIRLDPNQPDVDRLRPGMSVEPKVRVR